MFIVKSNGLEQVNAHLKFKINDTISITGDIVLLSGSYSHNNSIFYRYSKFSFSSNDEIVVPESCLSDKLNARNLLENLV